MFLVLIETSGNQNYIFATNKLRENVGASELISNVGKKVGEVAKEAARNASEQSGSGKVDLIVATSGKALLLVPELETAKRIVGEVTQHFLKEAPGLDVRGAICEVGQKHIHQVVKDVHRRHEQLRVCVPGPVERFQRLPVVAECSTSGLPAARCERQRGPGELGEFSAVSWAKRQAAEQGWERLRDMAGGIPLARSLDQLDRLEEVEWLAVVHADGNGFGKMFLNFDRLVKALTSSDDNEIYKRLLHDFSKSLDEIAKAAFQSALEVVFELWQQRQVARATPGKFLPVVPLVVGGDDLTVVCDGKLAIPFTTAYLQAFEEQTAKEGVVGDLAEKRETPIRRLGACAGVAIIKPHFPFYAAYGLAEELLKSAKVVKSKLNDWPCSALDVHVLYDASGPELKRIRTEWTLDGDHTLLTSRPLVVTPEENLAEVPQGKIWIHNHHVKRIEEAIQKLRATEEDGRPRLPNSMLHDLREGLFYGRQVADARLQLALGRHRVKDFGDGALIHRENGDSWSLFYQEDGWYVTRLLDAMDLAEFW